MEQLRYRWEEGGMLLEQVCRETQFSMPGEHVHDRYELYYLVAGMRYYFVGSRMYEVHAGDFVVIDRNLVHKTTAVLGQPHERFLAEISPQVLENLSQKAEGMPFADWFSAHSGVMRLRAEDRQTAEQLLRELEQEVHNGANGVALRLVFTRLLLLLTRAICVSASPEDARYRKIEQIAAFLSEQYRQPIVLDDLCARFYVSKYYLCRCFKEATGVTINEYLNHCRLRAAERLLRETSLRITDVMEESGFSTMTHFEQSFRRRTGLTPTAWRRKNR